MAVIFDGIPGRLVVVAATNPKAISLYLDIGGAQANGVMTRLDVDQSVAYQAQPSLDRAVYVIPFGDNVGQMQIGLILNSSCGEDAGSADRGVDQFISYYEEKRLSPTNPVPGQLTVGKKTFLGYAVGFKLALASESGYLAQGTLQFISWLAQK